MKITKPMPTFLVELTWTEAKALCRFHGRVSTQKVYELLKGPDVDEVDAVLGAFYNELLHALED